MTGATVSIVVPAFNAGATVERAVRSALVQPETGEVIVVDDASSDDTIDRVKGVQADDPRVRLIACSTNGGPARARNIGLDACREPRIALLDADDFFLPGRLARLGMLPDTDMAADDIAFVSDVDADSFNANVFARKGAVMTLDLARFAAGNITGRRQRGELGFLKPVMSRAFLTKHGLRYDETLKLGEDVDLYLRALIAGARFVLIRQVGYCAVVRAGSLSATHATADLAALCAAVERQSLLLPTGSAARANVAALATQLNRRRDHRLFLDRKAAAGLASALRFAFGARGRARLIAYDILRDKLRLRPVAVIPPDVGFRTLLGDHEAGRSPDG